MEKVTKEVIQKFITENEVELISTQKKLCLPIISRIYIKMLAGIKFSGIRIENNLICDGHHRYLASLLANFIIERIPSISTSATTVADWQSVVFEEDDWDTPAKIRMLNEQDANYNNMRFDDIVQLLK